MQPVTVLEFAAHTNVM